MAEPFIGEILMFAGNFAPNGWAFCNGQVMPINQYQALFTILGTTYGGNGTTTFQLPDLRGRVPVNFGQGTGLSNYYLGQSGGVETVNLNVTEIPAHTHPLSAASVTIAASANGGSSSAPAGNLIANGTDPSGTLTSPTQNFIPPAQGGVTGNIGGVTMAATIGTTGGSQPHTNIQPYLAVNFIIALNGIYPSRG